MKKIITGVILLTALYTTAYGGFFDNDGYKDNGFLGFNPNKMWEPRWYVKEADNFLNEFDTDNKNNHQFPAQAEQDYLYNPYQVARLCN